MARVSSGQKGYDTEELLRAYFLRAGFFVLRGLPLKFEGDDSTDIDLWLYERPTGTARRTQLIDAKFKQKPKAVERIFWTKGIADLLAVDGAFVATTDKRRSLRPVARKLGISLIDGTDLVRMKKSDKIQYHDRLSEEDFLAEIKKTDLDRNSKEATLIYNNVRERVGFDLGIPLLNAALRQFEIAAGSCVTCHNQSHSATTFGRLSYFTAAIVAVALDYLSIEEPFKPADERRQIFINAVRYGAKTEEEGTDRIKLAVALIRKYAPNGSPVASNVQHGAKADFGKIRAEVIADQAMRMSSNAQLFQSARALEHWSFMKALPTYDQLDVREKSFLGALLDFSGIAREAFAKAWKSQFTSESISEFNSIKTDFAQNQETSIGPLFDQLQ